MSKKILIILIILIGLGVGGFFISKNIYASSTNRVSADFRLSYFYYLLGDNFLNGEVTGIKHWETDTRNLQDETGESIKELAAEFTTDLTASNWRKEELIKTGPPVYKWFYGDIPQEGDYVAGGFRPESLVEFSGQSIAFTPGFDAYRSADKTVFSGPGVQTLTITVTPREKNIEEKSDGIFMCIYTVMPGAENLVDAVITSPASDGKNIEVSKDGRSLRIYEQPVKTNVPWTVTLTIEVTPKAPKVEFMPFVSVLWNLASFNDPVFKNSCVMDDATLYSKGTTIGSSVSCSVDAGTWKWSAEGDYTWEWLDTLSSYLVAFEHQQERLEKEKEVEAPTLKEVGTPIPEVIKKEELKEVLKEEEKETKKTKEITTEELIKKEAEKTKVSPPKNIFLKTWGIILNFFKRIFGT